MLASPRGQCLGQISAVAPADQRLLILARGEEGCLGIVALAAGDVARRYPFDPPHLKGDGRRSDGYTFGGERQSVVATTGLHEHGVLQAIRADRFPVEGEGSVDIGMSRVQLGISVCEMPRLRWTTAGISASRPPFPGAGPNLLVWMGARKVGAGFKVKADISRLPDVWNRPGQ